MNPAPDRGDHGIRLTIPDQPLEGHAGPVAVTGWQLESVPSAGLLRTFRHHHALRRIGDFPPGAREVELPQAVVDLMRHAADGRGRVQVDLGARPFLWVQQFHCHLPTNLPPHCEIRGPREDLFRLEIQPVGAQLARVNYEAGAFTPLAVPLLDCVFNLCRSRDNFFASIGSDRPYVVARDALRHYLLARWQANSISQELVWDASNGCFEYRPKHGRHRVELVERDLVIEWGVPARVAIRIDDGVVEEIDVGFPLDLPARLLLEAVRRVCAEPGEGRVYWFRADGCPLGTPVEVDV